jgi:5-methylcytosine-specific restriction endonuclease McrA
METTWFALRRKKCSAQVDAICGSLLLITQIPLDIYLYKELYFYLLFYLDCVMPDMRINILNRSVLLLNQNYEPLMVCNVKRAVMLIFLGKAEMVEKNSGWIHSVSTQVPIPSVIRLAWQVKVPQKRILLNRRNLLIRDNHTCQYCGRRTHPLTIDHIIPKHYGGKDTWENLVVACQACNHRKANLTPDQAGMKLIRRPKKPHYFFYLQEIIGLKDEHWKPYLFIKD